MGKFYLFQNGQITNIKPYYKKVRDNINEKVIICVSWIKESQEGFPSALKKGLLNLAKKLI